MGNDSWEYQGRQYHQWFGHGTKPADDLFAVDNAGERIAYVANTVIGHLPRAARSHASAAPDRDALAQLRQAMTAWYGARALSRDAFHQRFLDATTGDATVDCLRNAACGAIEARTPEALGAAGRELAGAMQQIGLDRWPRYLAAATERAGVAGDSADQPYQVAQLDQPSVRSDASPAAGAPAAAGQTPAQSLWAAGQAAYDKSPNDCSGAVRELLRLTDTPSMPFNDANDFMDKVGKHGSGWRQVTVEEASELANEGKVVIGGLAEPGGHGHILGVMPGPLRPAGGFMVGKTRIPSTPEQYPPAMSGSSNNSWPGTHSRGERTVHDAWGKDDYSRVTFWTYQ